MARLAASFVATDAHADLYAVIDNDDPLLDQYLANKDYTSLVIDNTTGGCAKALNGGAQIVLNCSVYPFYDIFIFMGDDGLPQTLNWDQAFEKALLGKSGFAFGDDLIQGENLPTQFAVTRDIVERMQGIAPPGITHLYVDNFAKQFGTDLGCLIYLPEVVIEHLHPMVNKAEWDEGYYRANSETLYKEDLLAMQIYLRSSEYADIVNALK